jgi:hypothetical protein
MKEKTAVCVAPAWPVTGFVRVNACSPTDLTRHMLGLGLLFPGHPWVIYRADFPGR